MGRGVWWATVHGVEESDTTERLSTTTLYARHCSETYVNSFIQPFQADYHQNILSDSRYLKQRLKIDRTHS